MTVPIRTSPTGVFDPALAHRHRLCVRCNQRKSWGEFYARERWEDGTMRYPRSRCKLCENRIGADRDRRVRDTADPATLADFKAAVNLRSQKYRDRRRSGRVRLDAGPLVAFLDGVRGSGDTIEMMAERGGMGAALLTKLMQRRIATVDLDVADRLLLAHGVFLCELYPLGVAA